MGKQRKKIVLEGWVSKYMRFNKKYIGMLRTPPHSKFKKIRITIEEISEEPRC